MFELFTIQYDINASTSAIRDNEENLLVEFDPPQKFKVKSRTDGAQIDWTDDRVDPRKGIRLVSTISTVLRQTLMLQIIMFRIITSRPTCPC